MAKISCEAVHCEYNCDGGCKLGKVNVHGKQADCCDETCCNSYTDKGKSGAVNSSAHSCACNSAQIMCDAGKCRYNKENMCTADRISVGCSGAHCTKETSCLTFATNKQ